MTTYHLQLVHFVLTAIKGKPFIHHGKFEKILKILIKIGNFSKKISMFRKNYQFFEKNTNLEKKLEEKAKFENILILRKNCHFWEKNCQFQKLKISQEKWSSFRKIANFQKKLPIFCKITTVSTQNTNCNGNILSMDHHGTKRHTVLDQLYDPPLLRYKH